MSRHIGYLRYLLRHEAGIQQVGFFENYFAIALTIFVKFCTNSDEFLSSSDMAESSESDLDKEDKNDNECL